jgi:hypothetical protein
MFRTTLLALALALGTGALHVGNLLDVVMKAAGNILDPDGDTTDAGGKLDPDGATATSDAGGKLDPNG